jgi:hypothetical protein
LKRKRYLSENPEDGGSVAIDGGIARCDALVENKRKRTNAPEVDPV